MTPNARGLVRRLEPYRTELLWAAVVVLAARRRFGALARVLIVLSVAFVSYGFVWILAH